MKNFRELLAICTIAGFSAFLVGYLAFVAGFNVYTGKLPRYDQTQATEPVNSSQLHVEPNNTAQQSYGDSSYLIQPSVVPFDTTTTKLVHEETLTITPTIQELIRQSNKASELPDWVR